LFQFSDYFENLLYFNKQTLTNHTINNISTNNLKMFIHDKILSIWENHWNSIPTFNRCQNVPITSIKIRYTFLTYPYLISKEPQPICDTCYQILTVKHIVEVYKIFHNMHGPEHATKHSKTTQ